MSRPFLKFIFFAPIFVAVPALNYFYDPGNLFSADRAARQVAGIISGGKNAIYGYLGDNDLVDKYYIQSLLRKNDVVILGSSRSMEIHAGDVPGTSFFNASTGGASLEETVAVCDMYFSRGMKPATIVLGLDPWNLNADYQLNNWRSVKPEYLEGLRRFDLVDARTRSLSWYFHVPSKYASLVSPVYFQSALKLFMRGLKGSNEAPAIRATDSEAYNVMMRMRDGSKVEEREIADADARAFAVRFANAPPTNVTDFPELDDNLKSILSGLVRALKKQGVQVVFFLAPFHPYAYARFLTSKKYVPILDAEEFYRELARAEGIRVFGSYDPGRTPCGETDFADGAHPKGACAKKILSAWRAAGVP